MRGLDEFINWTGGARNMLTESYVNEGFFSWLSGLVKSIGGRLNGVLQKWGGDFGKAIGGWSPDVQRLAQDTLQKSQQDAGNDWPTLQGTYQSMLKAVGDGINKAKVIFNDISGISGIDMTQMTQTINNVLINVAAQNKVDVTAYLQSPDTMAALDTLLSAAMMCQKNNVGVDVMTAILNASNTQQ